MIRVTAVFSFIIFVAIVDYLITFYYVEKKLWRKKK